MKNIAIVNGRVIDPANQLDFFSDIYIHNGNIVAIADKAPDGFVLEHVIDATDCIICPGLVDLSAHLVAARPYSLDIQSDLELAIQAGITHIVAPAYTPSVCLDISQIRHLLHCSSSVMGAKLYLIGALTQGLKGQYLNELSALKEAGCIGVSNGYSPLASNLIKQRCYNYAAMIGLTLFITLEDASLSHNGKMHEGETSFRLGIPGIPTLSESLALVNELLLIEEAGITAHFCRLSSAKALNLLIKSKQKLPVTCDVAIHQLYFTDENVCLENGLYHVKPPFRSAADLNGLRIGVKNNSIPAICSDHIKLGQEVKAVPYQDSMAGMASWPLLLPLTLKLADLTSMSLMDALSRVTSQPAEIVGIDAGHLNLNQPANLIVFNPNQSWSLSAKNLQQYGSNTPFAGEKLCGKVNHTLVAGRLVTAIKLSGSH